jgi:dienelactone hydrolase
MRKTDDKQNSMTMRTQSSSSNNSGLKSALRLGPKAWHTAAIFLLVCASLLYLSIFVGGGVYSLFNGLINLGFAVLLGFLSLSLGSLIVKVLSWIQLIQMPYRWVLFGSLGLLMSLMIPAVKLLSNAIIVVVYFVIAASLLGAGIGAANSAKKEGRPWKFPAALGIAGGLGLFILVIWIAWPGPSYVLPEAVIVRDEKPALHLEHPAEPGPYNVLKLTYGSGKDKHRSEYGKDVDIITTAVDVSQMVGKPMAPVLWLRNTYWGFSLNAVPLNARVWYPEGNGPFPLVLVVHGNHMMDDFSEPGYDYLGELLASRGYIVASVDQNFLNGGGFIEAILGSLKNENDARAYLLLQHLSLWHRWNESEGHLFKGMIDTDKIALIGHSRGGEAAAIAAAFNQLPYHPDHGDLRFDFDYNIQAVIAIAPSDGQFKPRRQGTELYDINYLVLQGSADSDVRSFQGAMQYDRVYFTDDSNYFKAAVYIQGANHGQFNTRWGRIDQTISRFFLDRSNIMPADEQVLAAKVFISSFLEDTLRGRHDYRFLFADPFRGQTWLPDTYYHIQHREGTAAIIADFGEDMDLTTLTVEEGSTYGENLLEWSEKPVELGSGRLRDSMSVYLSWPRDSSREARYTMTFPANLAESLSNKTLFFTVANVSKSREPVDFTIQLKDQGGERAALPLSHIAALPPSPQYSMFKKPLGVEFLAEPIFTTYSFMLSDFEKANNTFNPEALVEISFVFDSSAGAIYLDDVGFLP